MRHRIDSAAAMRVRGIVHAILDAGNETLSPATAEAMVVVMLSSFDGGYKAGVQAMTEGVRMMSEELQKAIDKEPLGGGARVD